MIDALFGSKTRVKLLHLFLNNPEKSFYVREITRLIDEQINSVRRELSNMLKVGIIVSDSEDNKLYYTVNQRYRHYAPMKAIFTDTNKNAAKEKRPVSWTEVVSRLVGLKLAVSAGALVPGSTSKIDLLFVGNVSQKQLANIVKKIEKVEGCELTYTLLTYDDFYYRLSVRDKFITEIINGKHSVLLDTEQILKEGEKNV